MFFAKQNIPRYFCGHFVHVLCQQKTVVRSFVRERCKKYICRTVITIIAIITLKNRSVNGVIQKLAGGRVVNFVFIATSFFIERQTICDDGTKKQFDTQSVLDSNRRTEKKRLRTS